MHDTQAKAQPRTGSQIQPPATKSLGMCVLRWLAIVPSIPLTYAAAQVLSLLSALLFHALRPLLPFGFGSGEDISLGPCFFFGLGGFASVVFAHGLAPTFKRFAAVLVSISIVCVSTILILRSFVFPNSLLDIVYTIGAAVAGVMASRKIGAFSETEPS